MANGDLVVGRDIDFQYAEPVDAKKKAKKRARKKKGDSASASAGSAADNSSGADSTLSAASVSTAGTAGSGMGANHHDFDAIHTRKGKRTSAKRFPSGFEDELLQTSEFMENLQRLVHGSMLNNLEGKGSAIAEFWAHLPMEERKQLLALPDRACLEKAVSDEQRSCPCDVCTVKRTAMVELQLRLCSANNDLLQSFASRLAEDDAVFLGSTLVHTVQQHIDSHLIAKLSKMPVRQLSLEELMDPCGAGERPLLDKSGCANASSAATIAAAAAAAASAMTSKMSMRQAVAAAAVPKANPSSSSASSSMTPEQIATRLINREPVDPASFNALVERLMPNRGPDPINQRRRIWEQMCSLFNDPRLVGTGAGADPSAGELASLKSAASEGSSVESVSIESSSAGAGSIESAVPGKPGVPSNAEISNAISELTSDLLKNEGERFLEMFDKLMPQPIAGDAESEKIYHNMEYMRGEIKKMLNFSVRPEKRVHPLQASDLARLRLVGDFMHMESQMKEGVAAIQSRRHPLEISDAASILDSTTNTSGIKNEALLQGGVDDAAVAKVIANDATIAEAFAAASATASGESDPDVNVQTILQNAWYIHHHYGRIVESRVLHAYREHVARKHQQSLLAELAEEEARAADALVRKQKEKDKKRNKKLAARQQREEEERRKAEEAARKAEIAREKEEKRRLQQLEADRAKQEAHRRRIEERLSKLGLDESAPSPETEKKKKKKSKRKDQTPPRQSTPPPVKAPQTKTPQTKTPPSKSPSKSPAKSPAGQKSPVQTPKSPASKPASQPSAIPAMSGPQVAQMPKISNIQSVSSHQPTQSFSPMQPPLSQIQSQSPHTQPLPSLAQPPLAQPPLAQPPLTQPPLSQPLGQGLFHQPLRLRQMRFDEDGLPSNLGMLRHSQNVQNVWQPAPYSRSVWADDWKDTKLSGRAGASPWAAPANATVPASVPSSVVSNGPGLQVIGVAARKAYSDVQGAAVDGFVASHVLHSTTQKHLNNQRISRNELYTACQMLPGFECTRDEMGLITHIKL